MLASTRAFADDAPVEKPAVDRPALPQSSPSGPAEPTGSKPTNANGATQASGRSSAQHEAPQHAKHASTANAGEGAPATGGTGRRVFPYLAAGPEILIGLSGGADFERANPALTGGFGVEIPIGRATGLGFELNGDLELAASSDRGTFTALLLRARLGQMLTPRNRVWGALGLGTAGYQSNSFAVGLAAGTSLMLVPKFGLDFSANLDFLGASSENVNGVYNHYPGGAVLSIAVRGLFELHR
jgi:hypothetical protein